MAVLAPARTRPWTTVACLVLVVAAAATWAARGGAFAAGVAEPPFYATRLTDTDHAGAALSILTAATLVAVGLLLVRAPLWLWLPLATADGLVARAGLNIERQGTFEWAWTFQRSAESRTEVRAALPFVRDDPAAFLRGYAHWGAWLPVHASGHPPGATLASWAVNRLTDGTAPAEAKFVILAGCLAIPATYLLGRALLDERGARFATLAAAFAPITLVESVTSWDGVYVVPATLAAALALRSATGRALGGAMTALGSFLSYALPLTTLWACITLALRREWRRAALAAGAATVATAVFLVVLHLLTGYDPVASFQQTQAAYLRGISSRRPYAYWLVADLLVLAIVLGPLLTLSLIHI